MVPLFILIAIFDELMQPDDELGPATIRTLFVLAETPKGKVIPVISRLPFVACDDEIVSSEVPTAVDTKAPGKANAVEVEEKKYAFVYAVVEEPMFFIC